MRKKLYVINSPSYVMNHPAHTCGQTLIDEPLSEHFTFIYANLAKFGLVDDVVIFPREGPHDKFRHEIIDRIDLGDGKIMEHNWNRHEKIDIINSDSNSFVYGFSRFEEFQYFKNSFNIVNPVGLNISRDNCLNRRHHHYALVDGVRHQNHFKVVPSDIPVRSCPTTSKRFLEIDVDQIQKTKKKYDWIIISSFDPRKRHIEFLNSISKNPEFKNLKGCIVGRNPDNKGRLNEGHHVMHHIVNSTLFKDKNFDIVLNADNNLMIELLAQSKISICTSAFDWGPRAMIEAIQAGVPIFTMPHIGAADWVVSGGNGEFIERIEDSEIALYEMLKKYDEGMYLEKSKEMSQAIKPENLYPAIVRDIKKYEDLYKQKAG